MEFWEAALLCCWMDGGRGGGMEGNEGWEGWEGEGIRKGVCNKCYIQTQVLYA